jgi:quercetin dioxygenase-like cupin family protein
MIQSPADQPAVVDLAALARSDELGRIPWSHQSADLSINLQVFDPGTETAEHVNREVDVLYVGIAGEGIVEIDRTPHRLTAGKAIVAPKGTPRALRGVGGRFACLSCHRRRAGLWPTPAPHRPASA